MNGHGATVEIWWSSLLAVDRSLMGLLDASEQERVASLGPSADQGRSMLGAALLRVAVGEHLGVPAGDVVVDRTCTECGRPHGRPRVTGPGEVAPYVSVSHSGLAVVIALTDATRVGVDVQRVADLRDESRLGDRDAAWEWVRREAVQKLGSGMAHAAVRPLRAPLDGYAAALATSTTRPPKDAELVVRHWPEGDRRAHLT